MSVHTMQSDNRAIWLRQYEHYDSYDIYYDSYFGRFVIEHGPDEWGLPYWLVME